MAARKRSSRKTARPHPQRWDKRPSGRIPWGMMLIGVGVAGLAWGALSPRLPGIPANKTQAPVAATRQAALALPERPQRRNADEAHPGRTARPHPGRHVESAPVVVAEDYSKVEDAVVLAPPAPPEPGNDVNRAVQPRPPGAFVPVASAEFAHNPQATGSVALTFDGCYDDGPVDAILSALETKGCHATFFIAGRFAERFPNSVRRISEAGMEIGNHSWDHPAFTKLSDSEIRRELARTSDLLENLTGRRPTLFRPPFGSRDGRVREVVAGEGYHTIYWALDSWDAVQRGIKSVEIRDRVLSRVRPGDVVLMHIGSRPTAEALPGILEGLERRGLRVIPVGELMGSG